MEPEAGGSVSERQEVCMTRIDKVVEGIHGIEDAYVNLYVLEEGREFTVVDAGVPALVGRVRTVAVLTGAATVGYIGSRSDTRPLSTTRLRRPPARPWHPRAGKPC
jgi:hypothetical protein